jgi:hypothetical protein
MTPRVLAVLLAASAAACGADREFDRIVRAVEKYYGVKRTHIPLMGMANFFVKVAHPAGTSGVKLAIFEDLPSAGDQADLDRFMNEVCAGRMHPVVVTRSRRVGESTYILTGPAGKSTEMLIATFESHEATVIDLTANMETLIKMLSAPESAHRMFWNKPGDDDGGR